MGQSTPSIGTGGRRPKMRLGGGDNRRSRLERERQTLETLIQFVKFVKKQVRSTWRRVTALLGT